jgi:hypothetical protein
MAAPIEYVQLTERDVVGLEGLGRGGLAVGENCEHANALIEKTNPKEATRRRRKAEMDRL